MMKSLIAVVLWLVSATAALAQAPQAPPATPEFPADARMAYVNLQVVLAKSKLGIAGSDQIRLLGAQRDAEVVAKQTEITGIAETLNGPGAAALSAAARSVLTRDLNNKRARLVFDQENWQIRLQEASEALLVEFRAQLLPVIEAIRGERGLLLVISLPHQGVVAADPRLDLSAEAIRRLDELAK